tara:strand:+ start:359 stop:526 length:168 start_codon:yes stop_codon:yes gene_type:complete
MYTLAKELNISPLECMQMPISLVVELLCIHQEVEEYKGDMLTKESDKVLNKTKKW